MDESEENIQSEDIQSVDSPTVKIKPKKRSLVERELETNLTARVTSPVTSEGSSTSRYGRARRLKTPAEIDNEKIMKPLKIDVSKQPQAYKMHASNSPINKEASKRTISVGSSIEDQIENIYNENISLSRFGSEEKAKSLSPAKKFNKVYIRKDLIQKPDTDTVVLIKNMFSPNKSNSHLNNILERSSEKYALNGHGKAWNGLPDTSSVVKTLDFDGKKKKKDVKEKVVTVNDKVTAYKDKVTAVKDKITTLKDSSTPVKEKNNSYKEKVTPVKEKIITNKDKVGSLKEKVASKNELFDLEAACEYQVGDLAWARVGTYPFWPCIVTREPYSDMFVKKKLFGRVERSVIHVTFFGDNGRRGWIVDNMLRKYHGRSEFEACRDKFTPEAKKKDPRLYAAHFVSEKKLPLWNVSVDEAETLMKEPKRLRIDILYDMLEKARASKTTPKREKRGKISRTDSDVSLSESLYDTLFSEDDGKTDDGSRSKRARNKSLDVSEVVTACLDNMAAKSGIIQIQRQSHMDRWLQKAKSKTPEKIQPKLHLMVEIEKKKDKKKKSKDGKKSHKTRKNDSLGSDTNLLPYQNEHDYSSVNYENHDINDSSNKNTESASGLDSTLDNSDIGVVVKIESLSSSMEDLSQDDIITTVVNDDIVMTDPEYIDKDNHLNEKNESDNVIDKTQSNSEHSLDSNHLNLSERSNTTVDSLSDDISNKVENESRLNDSHSSENQYKETNTETPLLKSDLTKNIQPRRSKRKRQTMEALNNSNNEKKAMVCSDIISKDGNDHNQKQEGDFINNKIDNINEHSLENNHLDKKEKIETKDKSSSDSFNDKNNEYHMDYCHSNEKELLETKESPFEIVNDKIENSNEHCLDSGRSNENENERIITKESSHSNSDLTSNVQPRRSKRKRQTFEGLNNSIAENKAKEPKLDLTESIIIDTTTSSNTESINEIVERTLESTQDCDSTDKESNVPTVSKLETDSSQLSKTIEFTSFNSSSKPVVVIEPLNLNGLETQLIIKGSKQLLQNNLLDSVINDISKDKISTLKVTSDEVQNNYINTILNDTKSSQADSTEVNDSNKSVNIKTDAVTDTQNQVTEVLTKDVQAVVSKQNHVKADKGSIDSKKMEVDSSLVGTETSLDPAVSLDTKIIDVQSLVPKNEDMLNKNNLTNVVIGDEIYFFDRTLSQDYDEIDAGECEKASNIPVDSKDKETDLPSVIKVRDDLISSENTVKKINDPEKSNEAVSINSIISKKTITKRTVRSKGKLDTKKPMTEPEFIKYLEIRQDALLDEQPDLTQDEIVSFLYKNWLYEEGNKSDIIKNDDDAQSNLVKGHQETTLQPKKTKNKSKVDNAPGLKDVDIRYMMHREKPPDLCKKETEDTDVFQNISRSKEETSPKDSCINNIQTNDLKSKDELLNSNVNDLSTNECGSVTSKPINEANTSNVGESTSNLPGHCVFLDKVFVHDDTKTKIDDNKGSTDDVSSKMNDEQNEISNQVTEENNGRCVFLDQSLTDAQSSDNIAKKRKLPRLRLNRIRKPIVKLNKIDDDLLIHENSVKKVNTDSGKCNDTALTKYNHHEEISNRSIIPSKETQDSKKTMNEPDFIKYLEIRQDALLEQQPDLTQDEIVTFLYQNWLYEEGNKSDIKKMDDNEQSNLVKGVNQEPLVAKKTKRKLKVEKGPEFESVDIREMLFREQLKEPLENDINNLYNQFNVPTQILNTIQNMCETKLKDPQSNEINETCTEESNSFEKNNDSIGVNSPDQNLNVCIESKYSESKNTKSLSQAYIGPIDEANSLIDNSSCAQDVPNVKFNVPTNTESIDIKKPTDIEDFKEAIYTDELKAHEKDTESCYEPAHSIINAHIESEDISSKCSTYNVFDPETASIKSEDSGVSITTSRKGRSKEKQDMKKSMNDPEFIKYLEARQDALIDEQPDLTQEEIVTYLYQTWFYEESQKSDEKKSEETEQSNLVKGLNPEPVPQPKKIKKKPKIEKEPKIEKDSVQKVLKNGDIRDMVQKDKPKRKATQSKPYYNEDDSDLEEEDLETFKIFDRDENNEDGDEVDEVELYFEQLTKPKPNVFKGYIRERVCEICDRAGNLVKCKSCHGTFHVECVKKEAEVIEIAAPTRGRKKKKGRKPKGYDPLLDSGSQSDERSQDANNSEELNISIEDESESHIVLDADNFETLWENKMKELQSENQDEYASDQEIDWEVEPGRCEIVDLKQKEKPIDYSDYKCNNCLKYETPICFVCKSDKSPKAQTEVRQKCQVAHCHRYYHLECLDHWPQTQFNSWEPSKTNKKVIEYIEALSCPRHVCHTCVSDDPRGCKTRFCGDKLARCVKCPATYHSYTKCLPAGTQILTGSQIICPRHYDHRPGKVPCHVNTGWCFICALGGTLICCEYCPTSFHAECLNIKPPEGSYMCEDCETGRLPLYGEMVWVKLGHYRWWPGIVLHPIEIPDNILAVKHSPGEFVVRFFGQYDHYWVNRGRVFPFQEGDSGKISSQKSKIDAAFTTAMEHAQRACEILKKMEPNEEEDLDIASSLLPPHYVKLKVNKPVGGVARRDADANSLTQCDCDPAQPDPCGVYSHCLNRMLLTECGPLCRAGERCHNRAFERRLYPRLQAYRTPQRGWGLRTLEDIKQGQFVIEYVGELIDLEEFRRRMCRKHEIRDENFYFLTLDKERMIDAGPKGNLARFMNHCCEPNCETQKWTVLGDVRVGLFALRDIPANSEVTFNYNLECAGIEKKRCLCGAKRCSGYIGAKPKQLQDDQPKKTKPPAKRTYKKRKPVEDATAKPKAPKIKIKPIKPRELTEIEKDLLIIKNATNGMSSDSDGSRVSLDDKNPKALKRKRVSFSTEDVLTKKAKIADSDVSEAV